MRIEYRKKAKYFNISIRKKTLLYQVVEFCIIKQDRVDKKSAISVIRVK